MPAFVWAAFKLPGIAQHMFTQAVGFHIIKETFPILSNGQIFCQDVTFSLDDIIHLIMTINSYHRGFGLRDQKESLISGKG